jgi:hypothetical protein
MLAIYLFGQMRQWVFMAHRGDDFNGSLRVFHGLRYRRAVRYPYFDDIILDFFRSSRFAVL